MQYSLYCDQVKCLEWGISVTDGIVLDYFLKAPSRVKQTIMEEGEILYKVQTTKLVKDLPCIASTARGFNQIVKRLIDKGLLKYKLVDNNTPFYRVSDKGLAWNMKIPSPNEATYPPSEQDNIAGANDTTDNPSTINTSTNSIISSNEEQAEPEYGKSDRNNLIETIKKACSKNGLLYSGKGAIERRAAGRILSKSFSERISEFGMTLEEFVNNVIMVSTKLKYNTKQVTSAKLIYYNREEIVNKAKQQSMKTVEQAPASFEAF